MTPAPAPHAELRIRSAAASDQPEALRLFLEGSLDPSAPDQHDPPDDIHSLLTAWLDNESAHLWVIDAPESTPHAIVGMVGIRERSETTAELCRLRVDPNYRNRGVGRALVEHALEHCRSRSYLKVVLDSYVQRTAAITLFERLGFRNAGERVSAGKRVMDFYLDLYTGST